MCCMHGLQRAVALCDLRAPGWASNMSRSLLRVQTSLSISCVEVADGRGGTERGTVRLKPQSFFSKSQFQVQFFDSFLFCCWWCHFSGEVCDVNRCGRNCSCVSLLFLVHSHVPKCRSGGRIHRPSCIPGICCCKHVVLIVCHVFDLMCVCVCAALCFVVLRCVVLCCVGCVGCVCTSDSTMFAC